MGMGTIIIHGSTRKWKCSELAPVEFAYKVIPPSLGTTIRSQVQEPFTLCGEDITPRIDHAR
jgi:hypothetical protein